MRIIVAPGKSSSTIFMIHTTPSLRPQPLYLGHILSQGQVKTNAIESMAYLNNLTVAIAQLMQTVLQEPRLKTVYQQFAASPIEMIERAMEIIYHPDKFLSLIRERLKGTKAS